MIFNYPYGSLLTPTNPAWTNHAIQAFTGTITTITVHRAEIYQIGQIRYAYLDFTIVTNGTGSNSLLFRLREPPNADGWLVFSGREVSLSGDQLLGWQHSTLDFVRLTRFDGTYPGANGRRLVVSGSYEV